MFLSETLELDCHSAEHGLVNYYNHALVGLSVRNRSQGERRIRGLRSISSHFRRPFTEAGIATLRVNSSNVKRRTDSVADTSEFCALVNWNSNLAFAVRASSA